jgi:maleylacetoacetate isomerase
MTAPLRLYSYWRSSAAWRVRIALHLKGVAYETLPVSLIDDGGQHRAADYTALNPQQLVPALVLPDGTVLTQSLAIIDWLDATYPAPALLPTDAVARAKVLAVAHAVAIDIHPVNNLRVVTALSELFGADAAAKTDWMAHWMRVGFDALETMVQPGPFAFGASPSLADVCLIPQIYNARRWHMDMSPWPHLLAVDSACSQHAAFTVTAPAVQPDAR